MCWFILEKNIPTKSKYDVWPSAYGYAAKKYKAEGGKWKKEKKSKK